MKSIFICTALKLIPHSDPDISWKITKQRSWAWFDTFAEAEKLILSGDELFFERGRYDRAIIEEYPSGFIAMAENTWWYQVIGSNKIIIHENSPEFVYSVIKTDKPNNFPITNIGMG